MGAVYQKSVIIKSVLVSMKQKLFDIFQRILKSIVFFIKNYLILPRGCRRRSSTPDVNIIRRYSLRGTREERIADRPFLGGSHVRGVVLGIFFFHVLLFGRWSTGRSETKHRFVRNRNGKKKKKKGRFIVLGSLDGNVLRLVRSSETLHFGNLVETVELRSTGSVRG